MKAVMIALLACLTAVACTWLLANHARTHRAVVHHYALHQFDEKFPNGFQSKSIFRIDTVSGNVWRLNMLGLPNYSKNGDGTSVAETVEGWEEIPSSFDEAFQQAINRRGLGNPSATDQTVSPKPVAPREPH